MPNAVTVVRNITQNPIPLPYPYKGLVYGSQAAYLADTVAHVLANLGGAAEIKGALDVHAVPAGQVIPVTYHDQSQQPSSGPQVPDPTAAQQPATKAYVDSAVVAPGAAAGGDLAGTYPNPTLAVVNKGVAQTLAGAGAVDVTHRTTKLTSTGAGQAITLADGTSVGQRKTIIHAVDGGSMILTPAHPAVFATITFTNVRDWCELEWNGATWDLVAFGGVTFT